ncbi:MAG: response regulator [Anaerolineae bacterium]|nr:response regulator [Anaerolineae bacterium]
MATVLIVEDNPEIADLYALAFSQHQTRVLGDVPEAIGYLQKGCPDLVIMDFHLPSGSGVDVLTYMRSRANLKDVPVLGISVDDTLKYEAKASGANAFMTKPIDVNELINTAQRLISSNRRVPSQEMRAALNEYAEAYQRIYNRPPKGQWTGSQVLIDGYPCDEVWLRSETRRLQSLVKSEPPRNYLHRLIDKIRRL